MYYNTHASKEAKASTQILPTQSNADELTFSLRYEDLASEISYNPMGGMDTPYNAFHDNYFYCRDVQCAVRLPDGKVLRLGTNPYGQLCKSIAKKWRMHRDWLPEVILTAPTEWEEQESVVGYEIINYLSAPVDDALTKCCYNALDELYARKKQDTHKTSAKVENNWVPSRIAIAKLFTGNPATVCEDTEVTLAEDGEYGYFTEREETRFQALARVFKSVKELHSHASPEKWLCAQCYALEMSTADGILKVYGAELSKVANKGQKAQVRALKAAKVKYSRNAHEVFSWLIEEANKNPDGLEWLFEIVQIAQ